MINKNNVFKLLGIAFVFISIVALNLDYPFDETDFKRHVYDIYKRKLHIVRGKEIKELLPKKASKSPCPENKTKCVLKNGVKVQILDVNGKKMAVSEVLTNKRYKPAGNTWCTKMKQCPENEDWWQGAKNTCEGMGMYLPDEYILRDISKFNGAYNLPTKGWFWTGVKADDYSRVYDFFMNNGQEYLNIRMYRRNNVMCVLYL